ncbi:MAG: penicillin-binding transpeptidase domain-containing protein, partial [Acidobacteriota bacterium]|nr:penicillin-binding transpeptidase domain-containing protein [Acidobacteriota bacterium]
MEARVLIQRARRFPQSKQRNFARAKFCCLAAMVVCAAAVWRGEVARRSLLPSFIKTQTTEKEIDEALQRTAVDALGQQEGTIIVVDPQTGRVRAIANQQVAFETSYAPGSTIKPFTALAALRAGLIDKNSTTLCRERYSHSDFHTVCAHPRDLPPFNPAEAIAYSCNYYFGTLGERLSEGVLSDTLSSFGFGKATSPGDDHNHVGQLLRGKNDPRNALGEGDHLQATPIQLIMAYAALVNGGHLLVPSVAASSEFQVSERAQLQIAPEHRAIIMAGMRGAVVYGTAARAGLNSSTMEVFGKTGTSTPSKGFRTQGWFVGLAATPNNESQPSPADIHLAVLVFLKRAHGANAAAMSRAMFEEYERFGTDAETLERKDTEIGGRGDAGTSLESSILQVSKIVKTDVPA